MEKISGFTYMICINKCPYKYQNYDKDSNECLETYPYNYLKRIKNEDNTYIFRCFNSCDSSSDPKEYKYEYKDSTTSSSIYYCLVECPNEAKYTFDDNDSNECRKDCGEKNS